ncbi:hypothetical protein B0H17DRAFT_360279 [Mycena rosella]|uniref:Uncharacterized protein n=1 Tax=Mycena rosella TaxID=1033263 RepID=A0AAD7CPK1_MYCRO|nr:hypothetical protein B0H17DRAFT_360279 [Mycena rosella]
MWPQRLHRHRRHPHQTKVYAASHSLAAVPSSTSTPHPHNPVRRYTATELRTFHCERVRKMPLLTQYTDWFRGSGWGGVGGLEEGRRDNLRHSRLVADLARRGRRPGARECLGPGDGGCGWRRRGCVERVARRVDVLARRLQLVTRRCLDLLTHARAPRLHREQQRSQRGRHGG